MYSGGNYLTVTHHAQNDSHCDLSKTYFVLKTLGEKHFAVLKLYLIHIELLTMLLLNWWFTIGTMTIYININYLKDFCVFLSFNMYLLSAR